MQRFTALYTALDETNRTNDKVNVRDMIDVGLVDATWLPRLPPELAARLLALLDDPDG